MNGISFLIRAHNEQATLEQSIVSLDKIIIPHQIVVVLNNCTDESEKIAQVLQKSRPHIEIHKYDYAISRAGYENLCTDALSPHSLVAYMNWCLSQCSFKWKFKWDADFVMTDGLAAYLNNFLLDKDNIAFRISADNSTSKNAEIYLTDCLRGYTKHIFWEIPSFNWSSEIRLAQDQNIIHASELSDMKNYWKKSPWFFDSATAEAELIRRRYKILQERIGAEPAGLARASNPECDHLFAKITETELPEIKFYD